MRVRLAVVGLLVVFFAACTSSGDTSQQASSPIAAPSASTSPKPKKLPLAQARLVGKFSVKLFVRSSNFQSKPATKQLWRFQPICSEGACDVRFKGEVKFAPTPGSLQRKPGGATGKFDMKLRNLGKSYAGFQTAFFATCGTKPNKDRWSFNIKLTAAKYIHDVWTATKWEGTWTRSSTPQGLCTASHLSAVIRGARASK